jgi:hypothetical protein
MGYYGWGKAKKIKDKSIKIKVEDGWKVIGLLGESITLNAKMLIFDSNSHKTFQLW